MKRTNVKKYLLSLMLVVLVSLVAACSNEDSKEAGSSEGDKKVSVVFRDTSNEGLKKLLKESEIAFEESHPGVDIEVVPIQATESDFFTKLALMMKSGKTAPDVITEDTFMIENDATAGYLAPLTDMVAEWEDWENFYEQVREGVKASDGEVYAVPYTTDTRGLWYNKEAFEKAGLPVPWNPKNWEDVKVAVEALKEKAPEVIPYLGYSGKATGEATTMQHFEMLLYGTNDTLYNFDTNKWIVESPGFLDSLKFIDHMYSNDLGPDLATILNAQAGSIVLDQLAPEGKLGIWLEGNWQPGLWETNGYEDWEDRYALTAMPTQDGQEPGFTSMSGGWSFAIYKDSKQQEQAFEFIQFLTNKENNTEFSINQGTLSPRADVAKDPEYAEAGYNKTASEFLNFTNYRPAVPDYPAVSGEIQAAVEAVATGSLSPEEAMEQYSNNVTRKVGEDKVETVK